jgi:flavin-dependent dehydrogenase
VPPASPLAVLGAGPAGATLARILAEHGLPVLLIDEREPHEKPCGGGVTVRGYRGRAALETTPGSCVEVRAAVLRSGMDEVVAPLPEAVRIYPRRELNRILFAAALNAGARFLKARVRGLIAVPAGFRIELASGPAETACFVAGADGAAGAARKLLGGGRGRERFVLALGFHARRAPAAGSLFIDFPRGLPGYAWIFPRPDHASVGICSRDPAHGPRFLRDRLAASLAAAGWNVERIPGTDYAFPVPDFASFAGPRAGPNWALIGDAGAFVDPLTLEGISHAMRSAEVLAGAILGGRPESFEGAWRADFGRELARAARHVARFYDGEFTSQMVRRSAAHPRLKRLLGRLLAGAAPYRGLRRRVTAALLADGLASLFRPRSGPPARAAAARGSVNAQ